MALMATSYLRKGGGWRVVVELEKAADGTRRRRYFDGATEDIARAKMASAYSDPVATVTPAGMGRGERAGIETTPGRVVITGTPGQPLAWGDLAKMLAARGLDPTDWRIERTVINEWEAHAVIKGEWVKATNHQLKVTLVPSVKTMLPAPARLDGPRYTVSPTAWADVDDDQSELVVILPDQQIPFQDDVLHELVCEWLDYNKPDRMVLSGDFYDFPSVSKHPKKAHELKMGGVQECLDVGYRIARDYVEAAGPTCYQRDIVPGNHEYRLQRVILDVLPELYNLHRAGDDLSKVFSLAHLSRLDELGFVWASDPVYEEDYPQGHINLTPKLAVYHGWVARPKSGESALKTLEHLGHSVIVGHTHRQADVAHTFHEIDGKLRIVRAAEAGTLARVKGGLGYSMAPNWQPGFLTVRVWPDGMFKIEMASYVNGVLLYQDQRYLKRSLRTQKAAA